MEKKQGDAERERQYCELCGKMENLLKCGRCRSSFYCSKEHQKQDWKKHKLSCKEPQLPSQKPGHTQPTGGDAKIPSGRADSASPSAAKAPGVGDRQGEDGASEGSTPNGQSSPSPQKLAAECIVPCMNKHGICVVENFLGAEVGQSVLDNVKALHHTGRFSDGQLVSQKGDSTKDIRGDQITWIEGKEAGCEKIRFLMGRMDDLIRHCNGKLGNYSINGRTKVYPKVGRSTRTRPGRFITQSLLFDDLVTGVPAVALCLPGTGWSWCRQGAGTKVTRVQREGEHLPYFSGD